MEPGVLVRSVIDDELGDDTQPAVVSLLDEGAEVIARAVLRMDVVIVGDVIPVVLARGRVEGQQPDRVDAELGNVVELRDQTGKVPDSVVV